MIIGVFIRNFKTYQGVNFIPLTNQYQFCGLLGKNGVGKSSVLEALDTFFNNRPWNLNFSVKRSGVAKSNPYIIPMFAIDKASNIPSDLLEFFQDLDCLFRSNRELNFGSASSARETFIRFQKSINDNQLLQDKYIIPIGVDHEGIETISVFESIYKTYYRQKNVDISDENLDSELKKFLNKSLAYIKEKFEYIYIPKEMDSELFTRLESKEIQTLMGERLKDTLSGITEHTISEINSNLSIFLNNLNGQLNGYEYRTPTRNQPKLRKNDVYKLIINEFFNIRKLHKREEDNYIEINSLSSGEKQKAIIDVAKGLLKNHRADGSNLIIAIDEPETSLHVSACFEQFDSLFDISRDCRQVLFSSHWYGFLPVLLEGNICVISNDSKGHLFDLINMHNYREQIEHMMQNSRGKLPYDINLKSITDFIQSILASIISENPYNWILCEGSSEKIYFDYYFEQQIMENKLRIIPTGGAKKIKRIYQNLLTPYEEIKNTIDNNTYQNWGKILFLSDTDAQILDYEIKRHDGLWCKRLINKEKSDRTVLVDINDSLTSPATEIEDCLNGKLFIETLRFFSSMEEYNYLTEIIKNDKEYSENSSFFVMDLRTSERKILHDFFDSDNGKMKIDFAKKYVDLAKESNSYQEPIWITEIKEWISNVN